VSLPQELCAFAGLTRGVVVLHSQFLPYMLPVKDRVPRTGELLPQLAQVLSEQAPGVAVGDITHLLLPVHVHNNHFVRPCCSPVDLSADAAQRAHALGMMKYRRVPSA
jgi:hypothetical protein